MSTEAAPQAPVTVTDVQYNITAGKVKPLGSVAQQQEKVGNDSDAPINKTITHVFDKYISGTWNDVKGNGSSQSFIAGVPFVTPDLEISVTPPSEHEFGTTAGIMGIAKHTFVVVIPAHSSGTAKVIVKTASIEVPFNYKQGAHKEKGIYKNIDTYDVDIDIEWD